MRIAYISADPGVPVFGTKGCSVHVQEMLRAFRRLGARPELFAARVSGASPRGLEQIRVHKLSCAESKDPAKREAVCLQANRQLLRMLSSAGPFDAIYERYSLWSYAGIEYAHSAGLPSVLEVNAPLIDEQAAHRSLIDRGSALDVARTVFSKASALVAVSDRVARHVLQISPAARARLHVIPNGVDAERFTPAQVDLDARKGFTIGFVGTLKPWHDLRVLVEAFDLVKSRCPDARLLIVGEGPGRTALMTDLATRGLLSHAELTGGVSHEEVPQLLARMDVAVAPYGEGDVYFSPLKLFEYMAAGVPVVATRVGQVKDVLCSGTTGLLVSPGNANALSDALLLLHNDPALRRRLAHAAREQVLARHTWNAAAERVLHLLSSRFNPVSLESA